MKTVWILALEGVLDSSLAITLDLLRTAQAIAARSRSPQAFRFEVVGSRARIATGGGLTLRTDATFRGVSASRRLPDWVIVPALGEYEQALNGELSATAIDKNYVQAKLDDLGGATAITELSAAPLAPSAAPAASAPAP